MQSVSNNEKIILRVIFNAREQNSPLLRVFSPVPVAAILHCFAAVSWEFKKQTTSTAESSSY